jgi:hypothetical protein
MRINNHFLSGLSVRAAGGLTPPRRPSRDRARGGSVHTSLELSRWLALARGEPETRPELLQRVAARLDSGFYNSAEIAEQTAAAILFAEE